MMSLARPGKTRGLIGKGLGFAGEEAVGRVFH